jgi:hypothetical protein
MLAEQDYAVESICQHTSCGDPTCVPKITLSCILIRTCKLYRSHVAASLLLAKA